MRPEDERPGDWREARRQRALELADAGWKGIRIAEALGVSKGAVSQWLSRREEQGADAFKTKPRTGRPPKLTLEQLEMIPSMLSQGAEAWGFRGQLWTGTRVAAILRWQFGVPYNPHYVAALLKRLRWSVQFPKKRAIQRDEETIQRWRLETWPQIKKKRVRSDDKLSL